MFGFKSITVNGEKLPFQGNKVTVSNNRIIVDGKVATKNIPNGTTVIVEGNAEYVESDGFVTVNGNSNNVNCSGSCSVTGNVHGTVHAGGSVNCGKVGGGVNAGGSVYVN